MKKTRNLLAVLLVLAMLGASVNLGPVQVEASVVQDTEPNNTTAEANAIQPGDTIEGSITEKDDLDYYSFTLASSGCLNLDMTSYMRYYCIIIYDEAGKEIWKTQNNEWTESVGYRNDKYPVYLEKGSFYMQVNGYEWGTSSKSTGKYTLQTGFESSGVSFEGDNNSFAQSNQISLGNTIIGQISQEDDYETYKFSLSNAGCATLNMTAYMRYYCIIIYDEAGKEIWKTQNNEWNENVGYRNDTYYVYLNQGSYFMQINGYEWGTSSKSTGKFHLQTTLTVSDVNFEGDDNSFAAANNIDLGTTITGQISENDDFDTYKFTLIKNTKLEIKIKAYMKYYCIYIYGLDGKEIWKTDRNKWNENVGYKEGDHIQELDPGTYYLQVNGYEWATYTKSPGRYLFACDDELNGVALIDKPTRKVTPDTPVPFPSSTPIPTPSTSITPLPTITPSPRVSTSPSPTISPLPTPSILPTPTPTPTWTPMPTSTPTPTPMPTPTPVPTPTPIPTWTPTPSDEPTIIPGPSDPNDYDYVGSTYINKLKAGRGKLTLRYSQATNADGYEVAIKRKGTKKWNTYYVTRTKVVWTGLARKKKYKVKVRAYAYSSGSNIYGSWTSVHTSAKIK